VGWHGGWAPYVPVAQRRARAAREMARLRRRGNDVQPVQISGRTIAHSFWGEAWCTHLERFSDYANRLPRGRSYLRNGLVCHLAIESGRIQAKVCGTNLYDVRIKVRPLPRDRWARLKSVCAGKVGSALELLEGRLSDRVMATVTDRDHGLFPGPRELSLDCSCPDWASMCKHVAAVLYGVGARLDAQPELLFVLRAVDHRELLGKVSARSLVDRTTSDSGRRLPESEVGEVFGIDLAPAVRPSAPNTGGPRARRASRTRPARRNASARTPSSRRGRAARTPPA
jgi:uncharacterized Zn finger protein